jgi:predicted DsbA family dithiol-disulfide isomerase
LAAEHKEGGMVALTVWSDYVCPWCYIGTSELASLKGEFPLSIDWRPFLLRPDAPDTGWDLPEALKERIKQAGNPLKERAKALGITLVERDHIPSSRRAHECTEFARAHGKLAEFHHNVIERYWSRGEDLSDWASLRGAATDAGLDGELMQAEVAGGRWKAAMQQGLEAAAEVGVQAVPTFVIAERFVVQGAQGADVFRQAFKRLASGV